MRALLFSLLLLLPALPAAAQRQETFEIDRPSGSRIEVTSVFSVVPPSGFAPIHVRITNNTESEISIPVSTRSNSGGHSLKSSFTLKAPARKTTDQELMVPLCPVSEPKNSGRSSFNVTVTTPLRSENASFGCGGCEDEPFPAYSHALAQKSIGDICDEAESHSSSSYPSAGEFAGLYDSAQLPSDWRGLMGLDVLCISSDEWAALSPGARTAVLHWIKLGGTLDLYRKAGAPSLSQLGILRGEQANSDSEGIQMGAGLVREFPWDGHELKGDAARSITSSRFNGTTRRLESAAGMAEDRTSPLLSALGRKDFAAGQVGVLLLIFGIIVGPVNLFVFARAGRRHRLFYTTPIISGAAALLLLVVIYFQDGTGGKGHRASVVYLDAADHTAYIHQQQVSRTGVLFGSGFTTESPMLVTQAVMPSSRWTRFKGETEDFYGRRERGEAQSFTVEDSAFAGDWFQSRAEQAQVIDAMQPTRGRLELKPGSNPPVLISSLPATIDALYYIDAAGKAWVAPGKLTTGAELTLSPSDREDVKTWLTTQLQGLPGDYASMLAADPTENQFYALSRDPAAGTVNTNDSIDWASSTVLLFGPLP